MYGLSVSRNGHVGNARTNAEPFRIKAERGSTAIKALCYKPGGRGLETGLFQFT
jgi:hypothetical protein